MVGEGFGMLCLIKEKSMTSLWIQSRDGKCLTQPSGTSVIQSEVGHSDQVTTFPSSHWSALKAQSCVCTWIAGFLMCIRLSIKLLEMWIDYKPSRTLFPNSCNCAGSFRDALSQPCSVTVHPKVEPISSEVSHLSPWIKHPSQTPAQRRLFLHLFVQMEGISYTNMGREIGFPGSPPESSNSPPLPKRVPFFLVLLLSVLHFSLLLHFFSAGVSYRRELYPAPFYGACFLLLDFPSK